MDSQQSSSQYLVMPHQEYSHQANARQETISAKDSSESTPPVLPFFARRSCLMGWDELTWRLTKEQSCKRPQTVLQGKWISADATKETQALDGDAFAAAASQEPRSPHVQLSYELRVGAIDFDHVLNPETKEWRPGTEPLRALFDVCRDQGLYLERGPSGDGFHAFVSLFAADGLRRAWRETGCKRTVPATDDLEDDPAVETWIEKRVVSHDTRRKLEGSPEDLTGPKNPDAFLQALRTAIHGTNDAPVRRGACWESADRVPVDVEFGPMHAELEERICRFAETDQDFACVWAMDRSARGDLGSDHSKWTMSLSSRLAFAATPSGWAFTLEEVAAVYCSFVERHRLSDAGDGPEIARKGALTLGRAFASREAAERLKAATEAPEDHDVEEALKDLAQFDHAPIRGKGADAIRDTLKKAGRILGGGIEKARGVIDDTRKAKALRKGEVGGKVSIDATAEVSEAMAVILDTLADASIPALFVDPVKRTACTVDSDGKRPPIRVTAKEGRIAKELGLRFRFVGTKGRTVPSAPKAFVSELLAAVEPSMGMPLLERVARTPWIDSKLLVQPSNTVARNFDRDSGVLYLPDRRARVEVPDAPNRDDAQGALKLLLEALDFEFADDASKANAVAAALTGALIRSGIPRPLFLVVGAERGIGKSTLSRVLSLAGTASRAKTVETGRTLEETEKQLEAALRRDPECIRLDDVKGGTALESQVLTVGLTDNRFGFRVLGTANYTDFENETLWLATGREVQLGGDLDVRTVPIRLLPRPKERPFLHDDLDGWAEANRAQLYAAALTVWRAYALAGSPKASTVPSAPHFPQWRKLLAGVLEWLEVPAFLENLERERAQATGGGEADTFRRAVIRAVHRGRHETKAADKQPEPDMLVMRGGLPDHFTIDEAIRALAASDLRDPETMSVRNEAQASLVSLAAGMKDPESLITGDVAKIPPRTASRLIAALVGEDGNGETGIRYVNPRGRKRSKAGRPDLGENKLVLLKLTPDGRGGANADGEGAQKGVSV